MKKYARTQILLVLILIFILACNLPGNNPIEVTPLAVQEVTTSAAVAESQSPTATSTPSNALKSSVV